MFLQDFVFDQQGMHDREKPRAVKPLSFELRIIREKKIDILMTVRSQGFGRNHSVDGPRLQKVFRSCTLRNKLKSKPRGRSPIANAVLFIGDPADGSNIQTIIV